MLLTNLELALLRNLIGKKAEAIIIPAAPDTVASPVEVILLMADKTGIVIDSCFRRKKPTEIPENYPQLRIRTIKKLPAYTQSQRISLGTDGEIIRRIQLVNEHYQEEKGMVEYSRAVHINFTGDQEAAFIRGSHRTANLEISKEKEWQKHLGNSIDFRQIITL